MYGMLLLKFMFSNLIRSFRHVVGFELFKLTPTPTFTTALLPCSMDLTIRPPILMLPLAYKSLGHLIPTFRY